MNLDRPVIVLAPKEEDIRINPIDFYGIETYMTYKNKLKALGFKDDVIKEAITVCAEQDKTNGTKDDVLRGVMILLQNKDALQQEPAKFSEEEYSKLTRQEKRSLQRKYKNVK